MRNPKTCFNLASSEKKTYERTNVSILSLAEQDLICTSGEQDENPEAGGAWIYRWN